MREEDGGSSSDAAVLERIMSFPHGTVEQEILIYKGPYPASRHPG